MSREQLESSNMVGRWMRFRPQPLWVMGWLDRLQMLLRRRSAYPLADKSNSLSCQPLFIVSAGRSGTTLLRSMLAAGGEIAIPLGRQFIPVAIRRFYTLQSLGWADLSRLVVAQFVSHHYFHLWETDPVPLMQKAISMEGSERSLAKLLDQVFLAYQEQQFPQAIMWGEQSPINALYLDWIVQTFPQARYLHLIRDGRDATASMVRANAGARTIAQATQRWRRSVLNANQLAENLPANQFVEIRYEDLVRHPETTLKQVTAFCSLTYKAEMLEYWKLPTTVEHRLFDHHRNLGKPLFTDSIGRWRERLSDEEKAFVESEIGPLLRTCGYDADGDS